MSTPHPQEDVQLIVFAAASLSDAFTEVAAVFEEAHPGVDVTLHFAGSQQLAHQISQGAPADVFASADDTQMQVAVASGRVKQGASIPFASNELIIVLPEENPAKLNTYLDLSQPGILLVLADEAVPVGQYSRAYLDKASQGLNRSYKSRVLENAVSFEQNVRAVLTKVFLGEADAGIVYSSDLIGLDSVTSLEIPAHLNIDVGYPIAPLTDSTHPELSGAFARFVQSPEGQRIVQKYGFKSKVPI